MNFLRGYYGSWMPTTLFGLLALTFGGCGSDTPPPADVARPVKMMVVTQGDNERIRTFPGTVSAARRAELAFQVSGLLLELPVVEGQQVSKGDVIARLRQDEFQARLAALTGQLDQARANLAALRQGERPEEIRRREAQVRAAEAQVVNARADLERMERLLTSRAISQQQYDQAESRFRVASEELLAAKELLQKGTFGREEDILAMEAQVRSLEAQVVEADLHLSDSTLLAPYDGVIAQRFVEQNQNIQANTPIVTFQDTEEIDISVDVPESVMINDIRLADILELTAELSGAPGLPFPVHIREIAQVADPVTQTFQVRVAMEVPEGIRALPGMSARTTVVYRRSELLEQPILVPISAISRQDQGTQGVWLVQENNTITRREVALGEASGGSVEIKSGLASGNRIVTAGVNALREGQQVRDLGNALGDVE